MPRRIPRRRGGSVYVHIDVKMEHRVRLLLDDIFGPENFRNSIARIKCNPKNFARHSYGVWSYYDLPQSGVCFRRFGALTTVIPAFAGIQRRTSPATVMERQA